MHLCLRKFSCAHRIPGMPKVSESQQSPDSLGAIADRLTDCATQISAVAEMMKAKGMDSLTVSNYSGLMLGMKKVEMFVGAARLATLEAIRKKGDFEAPAERPKKRA